MIEHVIAAALGAALFLWATFSLVKDALAHRRLVRTRGVFVGRTDAAGTRPGVAARSGRFRFTTEQGRTVEATSRFYSFPGPRPGRPVTVIYDPARPEATAERLGVHWALLLVFGPAVAAVGVAMMTLGLRGL
ncbi:DUF3592 domain-containing protein [Actinomadura flavalba]|uniref:DUF3592 domain-containing protein n=1 Tax=Actinomadura flavalba TaxID=1120938 RepID=UPI000363908E|nr:DUF3592 domain-containing protein [Actinomadura flavalba]